MCFCIRIYHDRLSGYQKLTMWTPMSFLHKSYGDNLKKYQNNSGDWLHLGLMQTHVCYVDNRPSPAWILKGSTSWDWNFSSKTLHLFMVHASRSPWFHNLIKNNLQHLQHQNVLYCARGAKKKIAGYVIQSWASIMLNN